MMGTVIDKQPLAALVRQAHDTGLSYREMADRARRAGHDISHTQLADYAGGKVMKAPSEKMLRAIAAAIDAAYGDVRAAMMEQFYGYTPRELRNRSSSRLTAVVPENLDPAEEAELVRVIETWLSLRQRDSE